MTLPYIQTRVKCLHRCGNNPRDTKRNRTRMESLELRFRGRVSP